METTIDLISKPGWEIEIQKELGFKDCYKLYITDEKGTCIVRVCKLKDEQFNISALIED